MTLGIALPGTALGLWRNPVAALFSTGEQGGWWDPSDFSTMFQDSAGTTPVTAVGQPVGMIRDKSGRGNHRTQATAASRPTLSARYNLLTYSEDFSNAVWMKANVAVGAGGVVTNDATNGEHRLFYDLGGGVIQTGPRVVRAKAGTASFIAITPTGLSTLYAEFNLSTGVVVSSAGCTATITAASDGYYDCKVDGAGVSGRYLIFNMGEVAGQAIPGTSYVGTGKTVVLARADLRTSADASLNIPAYQRITTASDYDTTGFPLYLSYDGVDDSMATGSVDFSATDKMTVWAGVHKASDAATGVYLETSIDANANNGCFHVLIPNNTDTPGYGWRARGTISSAAAVSAGYAAPVANVLTGQADIAGDSTSLRINGTSAAVTMTDMGTGNFTAQIVYFGRRNNASVPFNGREYQTIIRGAATSDSQIARVERFVAARMGVALA